MTLDVIKYSDPTPQEDVTWGDYGKAALSTAAGIGAGGAGLLREAFNYGNSPNAAQFFKEVQGIARHAGEDVEQSMTDEGRSRLGASVTSEKFWEHPFSSLALKATGMTPYMIAAALPGGLLADSSAALALGATAATGGVLGAGDVTEEVLSRIDKASDAELQKQSPLYRGYRADMDEKDAREEFGKQMLGMKPALAFALGVGTGLYGPAGNIVRGVSKDAVRHGIKAAAIEGALTETAEETYGAIAAQKAEKEGGIREKYDLSEIIARGLTGGAMGGLMGGASGIGGGHAKEKVHGETETAGRGEEEPAVQTTAEAAAPAQPIGVGAEAVKNIKKKAAAAAKGVEVVEPGAPNQAEKESITDLAQPDKPSLAQAAEAAQPEVPSPATPTPRPPGPEAVPPQQAAPTPPAEPVAAPPATPVPTVQEGPRAQGEMSEVTPGVTPPAEQAAPTPEAPAPQQPAAPVAQEAAPVAQEPPAATPPTEAPTPTGRVLTGTSEEALAREAEMQADVKKGQKAERRQERTQAQKAAEEAATAAGETVTKKSKKGTKRDTAVAERAAHAERIFGEDHKPLTMPEGADARNALADTLQLTLDKAASHGLVLRETIPEKVRNHFASSDTKKKKGITEKTSVTDEEQRAYDLSIPESVGHKGMSPHVRYLRELVGVIRALRSGAKWQGKDVSNRDRVAQFIAEHNAKDLRSLAERRAQTGDEKMRQTQGEPEEGMAGPKAKVAATAAGPTYAPRVMSAEEKAAAAKEIEARVNAPKEPAKPAAEPIKEAEAPTTAKPVEKVREKAAKERGKGAKKVEEARAAQKEEAAPEVVTPEVTEGTTAEEKGPKVDYAAMGRERAEKAIDLIEESHSAREEGEGVLKAELEVRHKASQEEIDAALKEYNKVWDARLAGPSEGKVEKETLAEKKAREQEEAEHAQWLKERQEEIAKRAAEREAKKPSKETVKEAIERLKKGKKKEEPVGPVVSNLRNFETGEEATPIETTNVREALKNLDFSHLEGVSAHIAPFMRKMLIDLVGDTPVHFLKDADMHRMASRVKGKLDKKTRGYFYRLINTKTKADRARFIAIRESERLDPTMAAHSVLHEVVHDLADRALETVPFNNAVVHMMRAVQAHLETSEELGDELAARYAMTEPKEFIAEAFSNREFQALLARIDAPESLTKLLKMPSKSSVWENILTAVRGLIEKAIGTKLPASPKLMEAVMKLGEHLEADRKERAAKGTIGQMSPSEMLAYTRERGQKSLSEVAQSSLSTDQVLDAATRGVKDAKINTKGMLARIKDMLSSTWNMAQRGAQYFGESNPLNRLFNARAAMEHEKGKILSEANADTVISDIANAERDHPELMKKIKDIAFDASLHDINLEGNNDHLGKDKLMGHQAKGEIARLKNAWNSKELDPVRKVISNAFKFYRDLHNEVSRATIKNILAEANIHDEALVDRIHNEGVSEEDKTWMDSHLLKELSQIRELKRKKGSFIPFRRYGDYISAADHELTVPSNGTKVNDNTIQFIDPTGKGGNARARAQVKMYLRQASHTPQGNKLVPAQIRKVWVDSRDPSKIVEAEDVNAIPAYQVSMQTSHVEMHQTEAEAENSRAALEEAGLNKPRTYKRDQAFEHTRGNLQSAMGAVLRSLEKQQRYINADATQKAAMREMFHDLTLGMSGTTSIKNSMRQRRNVAGMSRDLQKVTADYGRMVANHLAMLRHRPEIDSTFAFMRQYMKDHSDKDNIRRKEVYDEFVKRIYGTNTEEHKPGVVTRLLQMTRLSRLAGPSFHIINAHEPWTTSLPVIGGRHGFAKSMRALSEAYNLIGGRTGLVRGFQDMAKAYTNDNGFTNYPKLFKDAITKNKFMSETKKAHLMDMIDYMDKRNLFGNSAIFEVGRYADPSGNVLGRALDRADLMANQVGSAIEAINRTVTGLTAYQLEYAKNGGNHEAAMHYAYSTAHDTMGDYSNWNAAPVFNTPVGRFALQFKKFGHKTYNLLGNVMGGALRGDPQAMKQFAGLMVTHAMVAGALGLPTEPFKVALMAANMLGVTGFTPDDYEYAVRQLAARVAGQKGGEIISRGLYRGIGLEVSGRMGLDTLLTHGAPKSQKDADIKSWLFDTMAGAPAGYLLDQVKAMQAIMQGDVPGFIEKASPIRSIGDITKAAIGLSGPKKSAAGTTTQEQFTPYQAGLRALGFTPSSAAEMGALRGTVARESKRLSSSRSEVIQTWVDATGGDKVSAQRMVQKWNAAHPLKTEQISYQDLTNAARRQERDTKAEKHGVRIDKRTKPIYERAAGTFNP